MECRRVLLLTHFGESGFSAAQCHRTCDICLRNEGQVFAQRDMTQAARDLIRVPHLHPGMRCCTCGRALPLLHLAFMATAALVVIHFATASPWPALLHLWPCIAAAALSIHGHCCTGGHSFCHCCTVACAAALVVIHCCCCTWHSLRQLACAAALHSFSATADFDCWASECMHWLLPALCYCSGSLCPLCVSAVLLQVWCGLVSDMISYILTWSLLHKGPL